MEEDISPSSDTLRRPSGGRFAGEKICPAALFPAGELDRQGRKPRLPCTALSLPLPVVRLLLNVLQEIGKGHSVTITPVQRELTTQQAADFLQVSHPYLIKELLDKGVLSYREVGNSRRIRYEDLLRYQEAEEKEIARREAVTLLKNLLDKEYSLCDAVSFELMRQRGGDGGSDDGSPL